MKYIFIILAFLVLSVSCSDKEDKEVPEEEFHETPQTTETSKNEGIKKDVRQAFGEEATLPGYVENAMILIPDSILIDLNKVIYGDFNADDSEDFAAMVTNSLTGGKGFIIIHNAKEEEYLLFGAGKGINGIDDFNWIDIFEPIPKGEIIGQTLFDSITGDVTGPEEDNRFRLLGNGIYLHVDEGCGGGILYWDGNKYRWSRLE